MVGVFKENTIHSEAAHGFTQICGVFVPQKAIWVSKFQNIKHWLWKEYTQVGWLGGLCGLGR